MDKKNKASKQLKEKLFLARKNGYRRISKSDEKACGTFAEDYKRFLDKAKTEREAVIEAVELLKKNGCYLYSQGKKHEIWYSPKTGNYLTVGRHNQEEVATGTLKSIKNDAGIE